MVWRPTPIGNNKKMNMNRKIFPIMMEKDVFKETFSLNFQILVPSTTTSSLVSNIFLHALGVGAPHHLNRIAS